MDKLITNNFNLLGKVKAAQTIVTTSDVGKAGLFYEIKANPDQLSIRVNEIFARYGNNKEDYNLARAVYNTTRAPELFYYLWQTGYYQKSRYNMSGNFNTGFGNNQDFVFNPNHISELAEYSKNAIIYISDDMTDFVHTMCKSSSGDIVVVLFTNSIDKINVADVRNVTEQYDIPTFLITSDILPFDEKLEFVVTDEEKTWWNWAFDKGVAVEMYKALS